MNRYNEQYATTTGVNKNGQTITTLYKTHYKFGNALHEFLEPQYIKLWEGTAEALASDIEEQIELNDWERWNTSLHKGQRVEISEAIFYNLLGSVPPKRMERNYFEVGEAHHHEQGRAIHRACWIEGGKYYTGYPKF